MKSQLNIPTKIRVGFNRRNDTYTKKLGYVIYYDEKGKLRKETSFESWRHKVGAEFREYDNETKQTITGVHGEDMAPVDYDNVPTEGFVLNKKAGGYSTGWNHRATYCRIFDPRGFEFEISIPNLLFILQETNSIKGKGLEGSFVYSWDGKDIVLLPTTSQEYKESQEFTSLKTLKVGKTDVVEGCTYLTKDQKEIIYLGRYNWYEMGYDKDYRSKFVSIQNKQHIFVYVDKINDSFETTYPFLLLGGFTGLAKRISTDPISNFAEIFDKFAKSRFSTKPIGLESKPFKVRFKEVDVKSTTSWYNDQIEGDYYLKDNDNRYIKYSITPISDYQNQNSYDRGGIVFKGYDLVKVGSVQFENGVLRTESNSHNNYFDWRTNKVNYRFYTQEELMNKEFVSVFVKLESGNNVEINKY